VKVLHKKESWEWFGNAAHFICGHMCRFHMATKVGPWLVSSVGEMWPDRPGREIHAQVYDPKWLLANRNLKGDTFDAAYMERFGYEEIGYDRKFETMVFLAGERCTAKGCGCGLPSIGGSEMDGEGSNDAGTATKNHMAMCDRYSHIAAPKED
jgi:hypothetical protein